MKSKKALLAVLSAVVMGAAFAGCNNDSDKNDGVDNTTHTHSYVYTQIDGDSVNHKKTCSGCDEINETVAHVYDNDKDATCNDCGYEREIEQTAPHTHSYVYTKIDGDSVNHKKTCSGCDEVNETVAHVYDNDEDATCNDCGYEREIEQPAPHTHTYGEWQKNAEKHWKEATCDDLKAGDDGYITEEAEHVKGEDEKCVTCGYDMHVHTTGYEKDETGHWVIYTCGHELAKTLEAHADTDNDEACDTCGYNMHVHKYSEDWSSSASKHFHVAICDDLKDDKDNELYRIDVADHTYENGACTVCSRPEPTEPHEHTFADDWTAKGAEGHYHKPTCDDLETVDEGYYNSLTAHVKGENDKCEACGYDMHEHTTGYDKDETGHWLVYTCGHDGLEKNVEDHEYDDEADITCDVCGYVRKRTVYNVTFDAGEGTLAEGEETATTSGGKLASLPTPTAPAMHAFVGWFTAAENGTLVDTDYVFEAEEENVTLYAVYKLSKGDGLWLDTEKKGDFTNNDAANNQVWAYDIAITADDELEIWYNGDLVTNITNDPYSTDKIVLTADHKLALADGVDTSKSIFNLLYKYGANQIYVQEVVRADIGENDGIYVGETKVGTFSQNNTKTEIMATGVVVAARGTLTIKLGGETVKITNFGKADTVKAQLSNDGETVYIAEGTYDFYYDYGDNNGKLWLAGNTNADGELPEIDEELPDCLYYLAGAAAGFDIGWNTYATISAAPEHLRFTAGKDGTFSITVNLYVGDAFKVLTAGKEWNDAIEFKHLDGNTDNFSNDGGNIKAEISGNYTFTISESGRISFVRNGDAPELQIKYDIYVHGSFVPAWESRATTVVNVESGVFEFDFELSEGLDFGLKLANHNTGNQIDWGGDTNCTNNTDGGITSSGNFKCAVAGTYHFKVTISDDGTFAAIEISVVA